MKNKNFAVFVMLVLVVGFVISGALANYYPKFKLGMYIFGLPILAYGLTMIVYAWIINPIKSLTNKPKKK